MHPFKFDLTPFQQAFDFFSAFKQCCKTCIQIDTTFLPQLHVLQVNIGQKFKPFKCVFTCCFFPFPHLCEKFVTALVIHISIQLLDEEEDSNNDQAENIKPLNTKLDDLQTCNDLVGKHGSALQRAIVELQEVEDNPTLFTKLKFVNEKATLFRITANAMISVSETKLHPPPPHLFCLHVPYFPPLWPRGTLHLAKIPGSKLVEMQVETNDLQGYSTFSASARCNGNYCSICTKFPFLLLPNLLAFTPISCTITIYQWDGKFFCPLGKLLEFQTKNFG